jgi:predicted ABC-type ATPase
MRPQMMVVAGPRGSGKSAAFPVDSFGVDFFNADDRSAPLNSGPYQGITLEIRTTLGGRLRYSDALHRARWLRRGGDRRERKLKRVIAHALAGGHSAPSEQLQKIHKASVKNLARAIREMDRIVVYDNLAPGQRPKRMLVAEYGRAIWRNPVSVCPQWLQDALPQPKQAIKKLEIPTSQMF